MDYELEAQARFREYNKKQAEEFFQQYIKQITEHIETLKKHLKSDGVKVELDYSPESLIPLWEWYENKITLENKTEEEYQEEIAAYPEWMKDEISKTKISSKTLQYGMSIAVYFAEVFVKVTQGKIYWGYFTKPKNRMSVNQPVLLGFKAGDDLDPRLIVLNCTRRSSRERHKTRLYETYKVWTKYIE